MNLSDVFSKPEIIWFLIGLVLALLEFGIPGLIILFFGVGAWVTSLICLMFDIGVNTQIVIFLVSSLLSLFLLRKTFKKKFFKQDEDREDTLTDEFIGQTAVVEELITKEKPGRVTFKGARWEAAGDESLEPGTRVKIVSKESIKLHVAKL